MNAHRRRRSADEAIIPHLSAANTRGAVTLLQKTKDGSVFTLAPSVGGWGEPTNAEKTVKR